MTDKFKVWEYWSAFLGISAASVAIDRSLFLLIRNVTNSTDSNSNTIRIASDFARPYTRKMSFSVRELSV
ncbi:hypothetical protein [Sneathiella litorea]|uniref:Uncharacterized protein n=1 Tax=Sneathiella litorea TaxID=2606216 RepID=A0A6L8WCY8_9PROT|nr:hypothetical protein [Sneathiella litorea]MZR31997.1 hypothetical protein [Sneathiella litorea]